jgi:hypothetical protein
VARIINLGVLVESREQIIITIIVLSTVGALCYATDQRDNW